MNVDSCEVLVIGSGAGGAPTGALLAEAGFDVIIVEEGAWTKQGDTVPFSLDQMERQYRSAGVTAALGRPSISYTEGRCAGGGTEVNSGLYRRLPEATRERWQANFSIVEFDGDHLEPLFDEVEMALSVQTAPPGQTIPASEKMRLGASLLGWDHTETPRWIAYNQDANPTPRRQSMTETYLPRAISAGARMLCEHRVNKIVHANGRATHAELTDDNGEPLMISFDHVFVCGGAIQSPAILQRSGFRGLIGKGLAVHPTVKLAARFDEEINSVDDVPVHQIKEFAPTLSFGGSASHPGLIALSLADNWAEMRNYITSWREMAVYYAAITSEGRGRVTAVPGMRDPVVTYRLTNRDRHLLSQGLSRLAIMMLESGAKEIFPSAKNSIVVRSRRDLAVASKAFNVNNASVMTVHICSTIPMGEDRSVAPVNSFGKMHDVANIRVNDASLLPDAPGVNPQASVTAIAIRNARRFIEESR